MRTRPLPSTAAYTVPSVERYGSDRNPFGRSWMKAPIVGMAKPPVSGLLYCIFQPWHASGGAFLCSACSVSRLRP